MHRLLNMMMVLPLPVMLWLAWRGNLFRCAMLAGRGFFAFLLAMWLFGPLASLTVRLLGGSLPYLNALFFAVVWLAVWMALPIAVRRTVKPRADRMRFVWSRPGQVLCGGTAGWFTLHALASFLVLLPPCEGLYFAEDASPLWNSDRRSAYLFAGFTLTTPDILLPAQMEAGAAWVVGRLRAGETDRWRTSSPPSEVFRERYRSPWPTQRLESRRDALDRQIDRAWRDAVGADGVGAEMQTDNGCVIMAPVRVCHSMYRSHHARR